MATLLNHLGHYAPQVSQHQILGASSSYAAPHMTSQNLLPRIPDTGYGTSQAYPQTTSLYPTSVKNDSLKAPPPLGQHYYVDHMMNPHPYSSLYHGLDLNSIRRKNATRETTGPLKNWLKAHRKNPYPTKGEKVMLAIATRMTLTQVSTWFANARRRMKKDKVDDDNDDDQESLPDTIQTDTRERSGSLSSSVSHYSTSEGDTSKDLSDISDIDVDDSINKKRHAKKCVQRLFSPDPRPDPLMDPSSSPESVISDRLAMPETTESRLPSLSEVMPNFMAGSKYLEQRVGTVGTVGTVEAVGAVTSHVHSDTASHSQKPKIWSISEIIGSASSTLNTDNTSTVPYSYSNAPYSDYFSTSNTNYDYSVFNVNNYLAYAQQNYEHLQQSQSSVQYL